MKYQKGRDKIMKKFKKLFAIVSVLLTFSLIATACGTQPDDSAKPTPTTAPKNDSAATQAPDDEVSEDPEPTETVSAEEKVPIKILYSAGLCGIPIHLAKQLQFLEAEGLEEGIDYEYLTSSTPGPEMLATGQADVTFGLIAAMLAPLDNGLEAKTVLGVHTGCLQIIASSESGVKTVADLKGKKIGVEKLASSAHIVAQRALANEGIGSTADNMEVEFIVFDKENLPIALKNGAVDAISIGDPQATILVNEGAGISIFNSATSELLKDEYCCSLWVRNAAIEKYPDQVAAVVRAIQKAATWVDQNTELAAQIQLDNEWLVGDLEIDTHTINTFKYLTSVSGVEEALTRNILDMKELGLIREDTDADALAKNSFFRLDGVPDSITETVEAPIDPATQIKND